MSRIFNYKLAWKYLWGSRNFILFAGVVFLFSAVLGSFFQPDYLSEVIRKFIEQISAEFSGLTVGQTILKILHNNLMSSLLGMLGGVILGVYSLLSLIANGYVLGYVADKTSNIAGPMILFKLLPHGVFELPALIIALGLGVRLGIFIFSEKRIWKELIHRTENSFRVFLLIVIPLLIVAAIIEGVLMFVFN